MGSSVLWHGPGYFCSRISLRLGPLGTLSVSLASDARGRWSSPSPPDGHAVYDGLPRGPVHAHDGEASGAQYDGACPPTALRAVWGYGSVAMPDRQATHTAIAALRGTARVGWVLTVHAAQPGAPRAVSSQAWWEAAGCRIDPRGPRRWCMTALPARQASDVASSAVCMPRGMHTVVWGGGRAWEQPCAWGMQPSPRTIGRPRHSPFHICWTMAARLGTRRVWSPTCGRCRPSKRCFARRHQRIHHRIVPFLVAKHVTGASPKECFCTGACAMHRM